MLCLPPVEGAGGLKRLLKVLRACATPAGLRSGNAVGHDHHLLPAALSILVLLVVASLGRGRIVTAVATTEVAGGVGFPAKVGLDHLLAGGVLGGKVQELPCCERGLAAERVDECLVGRAADEGVDYVSVSDVGELIALFGETLNVLPEGLVGPLPVVTEVLGVTVGIN
jgi:hypothetical protein